MVRHSMMDTPAWIDLTGPAVKLHLHLIRLSLGQDNGSMYCSERGAAKAIGVSRNTASRAFVELVEHGFLAEVDKGYFKIKTKTATTWRLTHLPIAGRSAPTHDYKNWRPEQKSRAQKLTTTGPEFEPVAEKPASTGAKIGPVKTGNGGNLRNASGSNIGPHIDIPWDGNAAGLATERKSPSTPSNSAGGPRLASRTAA
jgi:hypothetical protein